MNKLDVLYEDNHLIAINKKVGEISQGDSTGDLPLPEIVKQWIKDKYAKPGNVFLGVSHRLDRPVSGIVLFAKTSKMLSRLNEAFRKDQVHKFYWAIVKNRPPKDEDTLIHYLVRNPKQNKSYAYKEEKPQAKRAELKYKLLSSSDNYYLLEIELITGRHHQIRSQLSAIGCPIKGDLKYGFPRSNPDGGISLHARRVEFVHPIARKPLVITAPLPKGTLWEVLSESLTD